MGRHDLRPFLIAVPSAVTIAGLVAGVAGLCLRSVPLIAVSLMLDILDGAMARKLRVETERGAVLDFAVDVTLAGAMAWTVSPWMLVCPILWQVVTCGRYSGRALITSALILSWVANR